MVPLGLGNGVACFHATLPGDDDPYIVSAVYQPGLAAAIDPDDRTRVRELIRTQVSARECAKDAHGFEAVVW